MSAKNNLPILETYFYTVCWIFGIVYSLYHVYLIGNKFEYLFRQDLSPGWSFLSRKKDSFDDEWKIWTYFILVTLSPWIIMHHIGARIVNYVNVQVLPMWYFVITSTCLIYNYGLNLFLVFFLQPVLFCILICCSKSRILIWLFCYVLSFVFTHEYTYSHYHVSVEDLQLLGPTLMWIYLRCISFSSDLLRKRITLREILVIFGYVFYLPCFFLGPILLYKEFSVKLINQTQKLRYASYTWLVLQNLRYLMWLFLTELGLHFVYINCLQPYIEMLLYIKNENVWIMYGIGFSMGQFFFLKYTVVYGLAITWTKADSFKSPDAPKCIAHIYLYSEMWRCFDQGLYFFIKRYIYNPCMELCPPKTTFKKIWVSALCFSFVFVWHGLYYSVFMWSLLNYCGIVTEMLARQMSKTSLYKSFKKYIGYRNERRFLAFICAPLTIISAISNFYFLGGRKVAETYFFYFYNRSSMFNMICLWFFVYSLCQVSMGINNRKKSRQQKPISDI